MPTISSKTRQTIKARFVQNAIPTQDDYADLINASLNQADDGIYKLPNEPLSIVGNTATPPVLRFYGDASATTWAWQIQLSSDNKAGFALVSGDNQTRLFFDTATGNVGIGTTAPTTKLQVQGSLGVTGATNLAALATSGTIAMSTDAFYLNNSSKNIGIGTSSPGAKLHIVETPSGIPASATTGSILIDHNDPGGASSIVFRSKGDSTDYAYLEYKEKTIGTNQSGLLTLSIQNDIDDHIALMPSGNVGIGTTTPATKLHVAGTLKVTDTTSLAALTTTGATSLATLTTTGDITMSTDAFYLNNSSKNIGVGTTSPGTKLTIAAQHNSGKDSESGMTFGGQLTLKSNAPQIDFIDTDNNDWSISVQSNKMFFVRQPWVDTDLVLDGLGNVGIGTASPIAKLQVVGATRTDSLTVSGATSLAALTTSGNVGIGTPTPTTVKLQVVGGGSIDTLTVSGTTSVNTLTTTSATSLNTLTATGATSLAALTTSGNIIMSTNAFYLDSSTKNVGIGTTSPGTKLSIEGGWSASKDSASGMTHGGQLTIKSNGPQIDFIDTDTNHNDWSIHVGDNKMYFVRQPWQYTDLVLDGAGNVGIGTDSPTAKLHIAGTLKANGATDLGGQVNMLTGSNPIRFSSAWTAFPDNITNGAEICNDTTTHKTLMIIGNRSAGNPRSVSIWDILNVKGNLNVDGNVGIGTGSPTAKLQVVGGSSIDTLTVTSTTGNNGLSVSGATSLNTLTATGATNLAALATSGNITMSTNAFYLDGSTRNIGIGTTSPGTKLTIEGAWSAGKDSASGMTYGGQLTIKSNGPQIDFIDTDNNDWSIHVNNNKMFFIRQPWQSTDLVLDGTGNVGIGTDSPTAKLQVAGTLTVTGAASLAALTASGATSLAVLTTSGNIAMSTDAFYLDSASKNIGIGTTSPNTKLQVAGSIYARGLSGPINDYTKAHYTLSGGGTIRWTKTGLFKWSQRFICISMGSTSIVPPGHINIRYPDAIKLTAWDGTARLTSEGIQLRAWEALYAIHTMELNEGAVTYRIVVYYQLPEVPINWILVAVMNGDDNSLKLGTGITIAPGASVTHGCPLPCGTIMMWSGQAADIPTGWAVCDGTNGTPNLQGRFILGSGQGTGLTSRTKDNWGGRETVTLTTTEMPSHSHAITDPGHSHTWTASRQRQGIDDSNYSSELSKGDSSTLDTMSKTTDSVGTGLSLANTGSGVAFNIMPPFYVLIYIMKSF